jgi:hypothetical protein
MKKILFASLGIAAIVAVSCKKDIEKNDVQKAGAATTASNVTLQGDILVNTTVGGNNNDTVTLKGIVYVRPNVTLTILPGTIVVGSDGVIDLINLQNNKGTLVVERGGDLIANGTNAAPIRFTSSKQVGSRAFGDWGGVVILGDAPITTTAGLTTNNFEAFAALTNGRNGYGGSNAADNSGIMTYCLIEFAGGIVTAPNAEVNGLTLCGVGSGTTINNIEVSNSGDDAFEWFGGTVSAQYLFSYHNKDDDFDFDEGYTGNLQFIIAYRDGVNAGDSALADNSGSEMIELDNNASASVFAGRNKTNPLIANATLVGPASSIPKVNPGGTAQAGRFDGGVYFRRSGLVTLVNSCVITQAMPTALATTPSTNASFFFPLGLGVSNVAYNIFQTTAAIPVALDNNESNAIVPPVGAGTLDNAHIAQLGTKFNTALASFASFAFGAALENTASSPSLTGGLDLAAAGLPFVGTTERGAVRSNDVWTGRSFISIATK